MPLMLIVPMIGDAILRLGTKTMVLKATGPAVVGPPFFAILMLRDW